MVSFCCEVCQDTIKKPKLDQHRSRCRGAVFTCLDCNRTFEGATYKQHNSCVTEVERYQKPNKRQRSNGLQEDNSLDNKDTNFSDKKAKLIGDYAKSKEKPKHFVEKVEDSKSASLVDILMNFDLSKQKSLDSIIKRIAKANSYETKRCRNEIMKNVTLKRSDSGDLILRKLSSSK